MSGGGERIGDKRIVQACLAVHRPNILVVVVVLLCTNEMTSDDPHSN